MEQDDDHPDSSILNLLVALNESPILVSVVCLTDMTKLLLLLYDLLEKSKES